MNPAQSRVGSRGGALGPGHLAVGQPWKRFARDDEAGPLPGSVRREERTFMAHPPVPELNGLIGVAVRALPDVPRDAALLGDIVIGLHPDVQVDEVGDGPHPRAGALHDDEWRARRDGQRPIASVRPPRRGNQGEGAVAAQVGERGDEQVIPFEQRLVPIEIVDAQHLCARDGGDKSGGDRGLAGTAAPVHCDDPRSAGMRSDECEDVLGQGARPAGAPGRYRRLLGLERHVITSRQDASRPGLRRGAGGAGWCCVGRGRRGHGFMLVVECAAPGRAGRGG